MSPRNAKRTAGGVAVVAIVLTAALWYLWPRPRIVPVKIIAEGDGCHEVRLNGLPPEEFLRRRLTSGVSSLGYPDETEAVILDALSEYLAASLAGCETEVARLRAPAGFNERSMGVAKRAAVNLQPQYRPDPAILDSDIAVAKWFLAHAEPWAWIDARSIEIAPRSGDEFAREFRAYNERLAARRNAAVSFPPSRYQSLFATVELPEERRGSARLLRVSCSFGMREGSYTVAPSLRLTVYFVMEEGAPKVLSIFLDGNHSALYQNLAL